MIINPPTALPWPGRSHQICLVQKKSLTNVNVTWKSLQSFSARALASELLQGRQSTTNCPAGNHQMMHPLSPISWTHSVEMQCGQSIVTTTSVVGRRVCPWKFQTMTASSCHNLQKHHFCNLLRSSRSRCPPALPVQREERFSSQKGTPPENTEKGWHLLFRKWKKPGPWDPSRPPVTKTPCKIWQVMLLAVHWVNRNLRLLINFRRFMNPKPA